MAAHTYPRVKREAGINLSHRFLGYYANGCRCSYCCGRKSASRTGVRHPDSNRRLGRPRRPIAKVEPGINLAHGLLRGYYNGCRCEFCMGDRERLMGYPRTHRGQRDYQLQHRYGIDHADFDRIFAAQGDACAICGTTAPIGGGWHVDHCHRTNVVRGVLCQKCNTGIGLLGDDPDVVTAAAEYLAAAFIRS